MESFEKSIYERDIEEDERMFAEAISDISVEEIPTAFDELSVQQLAENLKNTKLFILGETHGVRENADIIYTLFKKFGFRQLALEWEPELKQTAERFIESGGLAFDAIQNSPDGRITAGHFVLLKKLKDEGLLDALVCFNEQTQSGEWDERDANMAKNILANVSSSPTLVVAGNLHTEVAPIVFGDDKTEHHPMGELVKKQIPTVPSGKIKYLTGQYHNYGVRDFRGNSKGVELSKARFSKSESDVYVFELPEAHVAVVPNPHEKLWAPF